MSGHRAIIRIDEELCNGCGACLPSCAEGALRIENGKLRLIADKLCDGLGACLGSCPRGALSLELREAAPFEDPAASVCPSARPASGEAAARGAWPIKLALVPPDAPFLQGADIFLTADCAPGACTSFHARRGGSGPLLLCCPRLEDRQTMTQRLAALIRAMDGAGETVVMVTLDCGEETTYAADTRTEKTSEDTRSSAASQRTHLLAGAQPVVQSVQAPQVRGVAVLCQGGGNAGTQRRITELVSALTGVGASHITVNKMQS